MKLLKVWEDHCWLLSVNSVARYFLGDFLGDFLIGTATEQLYFLLSREFLSNGVRNN